MNRTNETLQDPQLQIRALLLRRLVLPALRTRAPTRPSRAPLALLPSFSFRPVRRSSSRQSGCLSRRPRGSRSSYPFSSLHLSPSPRSPRVGIPYARPTGESDTRVGLRGPGRSPSLVRGLIRSLSRFCRLLYIDTVRPDSPRTLTRVGRPDQEVTLPTPRNPGFVSGHRDFTRTHSDIQA